MYCSAEQYRDRKQRTGSLAKILSGYVAAVGVVDNNAAKG